MTLMIRYGLNDTLRRNRPIVNRLQAGFPDDDKDLLDFLYSHCAIERIFFRQ